MLYYKTIKLKQSIKPISFSYSNRYVEGYQDNFQVILKLFFPNKILLTVAVSQKDNIAR